MLNIRKSMVAALFALMLLWPILGCGLQTSGLSIDKLSTVNLDDHHPIELTIWLFGATGLEPLIRQYELQHSNIKVNLVHAQYEELHNKLQTAFAVNYGAPDICLIEVSFIERFKSFPDYFYNLKDFGAGSLSIQYLDWKWKQASSQDLEFVYGFPTDIGPIAMMYRPELFKEAGIADNREQLASKLRTWEDFIEVGKQVKLKTGKPMIDNINSLYRIVLGQAEQQYFDKQTGKLIVEENPAVQRAWKLAVEAKNNNLSANLPTWEPSWGNGITTGAFASMLAPAWMLNYVKDAAPKGSGQWDLTYLPEGSGNWGGSFLTLPKQGQHPQEAYAMICWLTSPKQQLELYNQTNNFPSTHSIYEDSSIKGKTDPYFGDAPVGEIFSVAARKVIPVYEGPKQHIVTTVIEASLDKVERQEESPEEAWTDAMKLLKKQLK